MQEERDISIEDLDLIPGYRAERDGADVSLVDFEGRRVARLPGHLASKEPMAPDQEWQGLCESLLMLARSHAIECDVLHERVRELERRLEETKAERDRSDRIAEDLYEFFSRTAQRVARRRR